jgi:adenylate cyclase
LVHDGLDPETADPAMRHAHAAITYLRDERYGSRPSRVRHRVEHDRRTAIEAFEAALTLSPSCSFALILGSIAMGWANEAERALEWGERAVRLSPFDPAHLSRAHWACSWTFCEGTL